MSANTSVFEPALSLTAVPDIPPGRQPAEQPRAQVGQPQGDELLIGADGIAVLGGEGDGGAQRLAVNDQRDAQGPGEEHRDVRPADGGQAHRRQAGRDGTDDRDPIRRQLKERAHRDAEREDQQPGRDARGDAFQPEEDDQRAEADGEGVPIGVPEVDDDVPELGQRIARALAHPEDLVQLAHADKARQAKDEAFHHGPRDELRDEPQLEHPGHDEDGADEQGGRRGQRHVRLLVARAERQHGGRRL
jgi:hypothetical protein